MYLTLAANNYRRDYKLVSVRESWEGPTRSIQRIAHVKVDFDAIWQKLHQIDRLYLLFPDAQFRRRKD